MDKLNFGKALEALEEGKIISRASWIEKGAGSVIVKQIPATIGLDIIPKMQSLPQVAKNFLMATGKAISYQNQLIRLSDALDGVYRADSWSPSSDDVFADDWYIVTHVHGPALGGGSRIVFDLTKMPAKTHEFDGYQGGI